MHHTQGHLLLAKTCRGHAPLSKDPEGLSVSQSALRCVTKTQFTLQHQSKEMTQGKGISKLLCMNWAAYLYRIAGSQQNSVVPPTARKVRVCVPKPQKKEDMCSLRYSPSYLTAWKCIRLPLKLTEACYQYHFVFHQWRGVLKGT